MTRFYCNISRFVIIFVLFVGGCAAVKKEPSVIRKAALARITASVRAFHILNRFLLTEVSCSAKTALPLIT
jgi:hypothetical protein